MSMKELLEAKHPTAWSEFEKGLIDECHNNFKKIMETPEYMMPFLFSVYLKL
ncbi:Catalytic/ hydrolase [Zea mays]|uniref:Catalytic/ hydrolase n=1 Tax=Zea mays TaxID=4577 RepID=A0A1D6PSP7_MAIZE|nr:Catalytic/ hydrolase [Zea mays]